MANYRVYTTGHDAPFFEVRNCDGWFSGQGSDTPEGFIHFHRGPLDGEHLVLSSFNETHVIGVILTG